MDIVLGVDTLSYHCRLAAGEISLEDVLREIADLGFAFVQLNAVHVRDRDTAGLEGLRALADDVGLGITLSGDVVGRVGNGDTIDGGVDRITRWVALAETLGSPFARVSSGFYRAELFDEPGLIAAEQRYVTDTLRRAVDDVPGDVQILLENHSDFTADEYAEIIAGVGSHRVGVFLDLINPISSLQDPLPVITRLAPLAPSGHVKDFRLVSRYVEDRFHRRGFDVQWCYPGEGVADLTSLVGVLAGSAERAEPYRLSVEGLDNHPGVADQRERLAASLTFLRTLVTDVPAERGRRWTSA
ncbi:sugar phosphate isomerase/epimerase family protein [Pseudonocardia sp.]|uniref:sugar phosphate isomerase/epimerase family protein n=1 Tax=Pseudonocardia sp. TaxID=60912 RepID=UPI003D0C1001